MVIAIKFWTYSITECLIIIYVLYLYVLKILHFNIDRYEQF